jgi:hypothetical protein
VDAIPVYWEGDLLAYMDFLEVVEYFSLLLNGFDNGYMLPVPSSLRADLYRRRRADAFRGRRSSILSPLWFL